MDMRLMNRRTDSRGTVRRTAARREPARQAIPAKLGHLSAMDLFRDLKAEEIEEIDRAMIQHSCSKGRVLYTPGETGEVLYILRTGSVQIYQMSPEGLKLVIAVLGPDAFFGEMGCIGQGMYDTFAEAVEDSVIYALSRRDVERLLLAKPKVAIRILEAVGRRVVEAERQLEELAFRGLIPRLASLLLKEADGDLVAGMTHRDIAERLGVYRESATTALGELKGSGMIDIGRRRVTITDRSGLERTAAW